MRGTHLFCLCLCAMTAAHAADWPQWRGVNRDGKSPETGLLQSWPEGGPPLVWKASGLGAGFASFAVANGRVYTQGQRDGRQYVMAFDLASGKKIWETQNGSSYDDSRGDGPRGTPTLHGDLLYALSAGGNLICLDAAFGREVWAVDLFAAYNARNIRWGISESPLIDNGRVIVTPGGSRAGIVALDAKTGRQIWQSARDEAGYSSAVVAQVDGLRQYITVTGTAAVGVRADDGKVLWRYEPVSNRTANIATPIVRDNHVFVSTDYGTGCALLKLSPSGGAEEVYFNKDMRNHYSSSILLDEHLYGYSSRIFTCMRFQTGEVAWRDRAVGKGQVIYADGRLYLLGEDGAVGLAEPSPEAYKEISRFSIGRGRYPTWTLPVIADGRLLLRDQDTLYCYNIRAE